MKLTKEQIKEIKEQQEQKNSTKEEVKFWDRAIVPISIITDHLLLNIFGKSIICVYKKIN